MTFSIERHVAPQVEALEHHAELGADALDLAAVGRHGVAVAVGLQLDLLAVDADQAAGRVFQAVDAAKQRRLAGARAADDGDHVAVARRERDALQHMQFAELLVQVLDVNGFGGAVAHVLRGRRCGGGLHHVSRSTLAFGGFRESLTHHPCHKRLPFCQDGPVALAAVNRLLWPLQVSKRHVY